MAPNQTDIRQQVRSVELFKEKQNGRSKI